MRLQGHKNDNDLNFFIGISKKNDDRMKYVVAQLKKKLF